MDPDDQRRQWFQQILDGDPDVIVVRDADGVIILANQAAATLFRTTRVHMIGRRDADLGPAGDDVARMLRADGEAPCEKSVADAGTHARRWFQVFHLPLTDTKRAARDVLTLAREITESKQLEEQLRQAQKMEAVGQLTGGIAHDLNNVLTAIGANADLLAADLPPELGALRSDIAALQQAAGRGTAMIRRMLAFSRRSTLTLQPLNLATLLADLAGTLRRLLPSTIEIRVVADEHFPAIQADAGAVEQVMLNLATNARDAMPEGGSLRIEMRRAWLDEESRRTSGWGEPGEYACCSVSDTGTGMDVVTRARVFEPFFTTKAAGFGTGLGMAMVYGLMKQHRGFVDLYSELGQGTTVKLYFPLSKEPATEGTLVAAPIAPPRGRETILVADDEEPIRRAAQRVLERLGYRVLVATNGEEALQLITAQGADIALLLTDMVMPKLGGRELAERLLQAGKRVPVLFSSGYTARDIRENNALPPGQSFLHKPWTATELAHRVREVLDAAAAHPNGA